MPKAQRKPTAAKAARSEPLTPRNANATKKPAKGKKTAAQRNTVEEGNAKETSKKPEEDASQQAKDASNYLIKVFLPGTENPTVSRLLSLPPHLNFGQLDQVLQVAFGWTNSHAHKFDVCLIDDEPINPMGPPVQMSLCKDSLCDEDENFKESEYNLADVYEKPEWKDKVAIEYEYDFGDSWTHHLALIGRATTGTNAQFGVPKDVEVFCLGGEGHGVAEDAGGNEGWRGLKEAFRQPRKKDNKELIDWYKEDCYNGDKKGLDPYRWDTLDVNDGLRKLVEGDFPEESGED